MSRKMKNFKTSLSNTSKSTEQKQTTTNAKSVLQQNTSTLPTTLQAFNRAITAYLKDLD
ncbi:MAG TPA: hypothetical protein PLN13_06315 [Bacteroidia bacterium]|nr:hypothetical protein [Bacteroidia bacterium]